MIKADRGQIEQILMNLVVNSRDAMPTGGAITIEVAPLDTAAPPETASPDEAPDGLVTLTVVDTGCGMDEVTLENLFDPFYTTKPVGEGTGLGMSIVYGIVQQYGGRIEADSKPGAGTTIRVTFPKHAEEPGTAPPDPDDLHGPEGRETILVVEDEAEVRAMIAEVLESSGYTVFEAAGAEEALRVCTAEENAVDLVLTDVIMPGHSGGELATWLGERMPDLRLMFMSGYTDDAVVRSGAFSRGNVFLQKPFRLSDLLHKVREALDSDPPRADATPRTEAA
jgi:CheY-like chemotaxis protein